MKFIQQTLHILRVEAQFFVHFPQLLWATVFVALLPALYATIYLSSVWDPAGNSGALPVGLVNLDQGVHYREHGFNIGHDVVTKLRVSRNFGYVDFTSEDEARRKVRRGELAFALIIPPDFSSNALPGQEPGGGKLVVFASEGNNFESAQIARHFAQELGHNVNENLNERRWQLVLSSAAGSQRNVDMLRDNVAQLRSGAQELSSGARQAAAGSRSVAVGSERLGTSVEQFTQGFKQLASGIRTMDAKRPPVSDLTKLKNGADALAAGHAELDKGLAELHSGSRQLREGSASFRDEARDSILTPSSVGEGLDKLHGGLVQLDTGLQAAGGSQKKLLDGANTLSAGVGTLTTGVRALNSGIRTAAAMLPEDSQLDELNAGASSLLTGSKAISDGTQKLKVGSDRLASGLELLADSLPARVDRLEGSAQGLATSVQPIVELEASVANSGSGFAPNILPAALWLGAGIAAFLFHVRVLPRDARGFSRFAQVSGKLLIPAAIVLVQAGLLLVTVLCVLRIRISHPWAFAMALVVAALTFLCIVFALTRAFGDAGKALAMIFLAVQLSSSGGILPVELSGALFADISPWLPLTWVVRAFKATMFGAYDHAWLGPLALVALAGLVAALSACFIGRWRFVRPGSVRPAVDL
ncbi:MAG: YhgE/Pip domain-containing protein [Rhodoferax sp.]|nr:YhgE/Pip domain-containing protein [Rhodoferax sp.]